MLGALGVAAAVGCSSSDGSSAGPGSAGSAGSAGGPSSGGRGGGTASGGTGTAGSIGHGGTGGAGTEPAADGGEGGDGSSTFSLHLSADATPLILPITTGGHDRFYGVTFDPDDNIYAVGVTAPGTATATDFSTVVAKFTPEGALDTSFGEQGYAIRNAVVGTNGEFARGIVLQSTGKIVVSETLEHLGGDDVRDRDVALLRFNADGSKDTTFGEDGIVTLDLSTGVALSATSFLADSAWGLAVYPDDRLVLSGGLVSSRGTDTDFALVRLSADGELDMSFGTAGVFTLDTLIDDVSNNASPRNLTLLPGAQGIIGAGYQPIPPADTRAVVYRVTDDGKLDLSFGTAGVFSESVLTEQTETYAAVSQSDGKLVTTGYGRELETETTDIVSLRLNTDGTRDMSYGDGGLVRLDIGGFADNSRKLLTLPNDHIVLVGGGRPVADNVDGVVVALTADGQPDTSFTESGWKTFDLGGPADFIWGVALSPSQTRIAAVGIKGVGTAATTGDDDAALLVLKLVP
jgi:uncharacterized delta-60 repeat protein